jgi:hypothetical protein
MRRYMDIKKIVPLLVIVVFSVAIGVSMISTVASQDKKEQAAWNEVLKEDREMADAARQASALVDRLEKVMNEEPGGGPEAARLQEDIIAVWPSFARKGTSGAVTLPAFDVMRRQLNFYIHRG